MTGEVIMNSDGMYQQALKYTLELFRDGYSEQVIAEWTAKSFTALTPENVQFILYKASERIAQQYFRDSSSVVSLHVKRYGQDIKELMEEKFENFPIGERRGLRINALMQVLEIMLAKEKVLQLHTKDVQVKVFNKLNAKVKVKKSMFNLASLTLEEKIEFLTLITKAKKSNSELHGVIMKPKDETTIDIDHVEVKEEEVNINQIQKLNVPKEIVPFDPKPVKVEDITNKIQEALKKRAELEFKKKGASLDHSKGPLIIDYRELHKPSESTSNQ